MVKVVLNRERNGKDLSLFILGLILGYFIVVGGVLGANYSVCSSGCDFTTIQGAVNGASNGDTINVMAGNYTENVDVNKSVNLIGAGEQSTILHVTNFRHTINITANYVNLSGFNIEGVSEWENYGIFINNSNFSRCFNNNINFTQSGIHIINSYNTLIFNNTLQNNLHGISASQNTSIFNNTVFRNNFGISFSNNCIISGNNVLNNSFGMSFGNNNNIIERNLIIGNSVGIEGGGINNIIKNNQIKENGYDIDLYASDDSRCNNVIKENIGSGDRPIGYFNLSVDLNYETFSELILCNADFSTINNVTISGSASKKNNMLLLVRTDNSNFSNVVSSNNSNGILLRNSHNNSINNSITNNNLNAGFYIQGSNNNKLLRNNAIKNRNHGIISYRSNNTEFDENIANFNGKNGIYILQSYYNEANNNTAISNGNYGIKIGYSNENGLNGNIISNNILSGMKIENSVKNFIINNNLNNINNVEYEPYGLLFNSFNISKQLNNNIIGGPYLGGNFWAYPNGTGFSQTCTDADGDGICDSIYNITSGNVDYLPLATYSPQKPIIIVESKNISLGESALLNINITNVTYLNTVSFNLTFNPSIINITYISLGDFLAGATITTNIQNSKGWASVIIDLPAGFGVNGSGAIAQINVTGVGIGFSNLTLLPLGGIYLSDKNGQEIIPEVVNGWVNVSGEVDKIPPQIRFGPLTMENNYISNGTAIIEILHNETNPDTLILSWNGINESLPFLPIGSPGGGGGGSPCDSGSFTGGMTKVFKSCLTDGTYTYYAWANDTSGNHNRTETRTVHIDTTPPIITIQSPINTTYNTDSVPLSVSANEPIDTWWYSLDGGPNVTFIPNITLSGLLEGNHSLVVYANDSLGHISLNEYIFEKQWGIIFPFKGQYNFKSVTVDSLNNTVAVGYIYRDGNSDFLIAKYNSSGYLEWYKNYGDEYWDYADYVGIDSFDNIIVTGQIYNSKNDDFQTLKLSPQGDLIWNATYDGGKSDRPYDLAIDSSDNIVVTGYAYGTNADYLTIKYWPNGSIYWAEKFDSGKSEYPRVVAVDSSGNIVVTGNMYGANADYLTVKYWPNGSIFWTKGFDGGKYDYAEDLAFDSNDNILITGRSDRTNSDYYTIKYYPNGTEAWGRFFDGGSSDSAYGIAADGSGNVIVTGGSNNGINQDFLTVKYDPAGNEQWNVSFDNGEWEEAKEISIDSQENIIIAGSSNGVHSIKYNSSGKELWTNYYPRGYFNNYATDSGDNIYISTGSNLILYNSSGRIIWINQFDTIRDFRGDSSAVDHEGSVYINGGFFNGMKIEPMTVKYDNHGNFLWNRSIDFTGTSELALLGNASSRMIDGLNNLILYGWISNETSELLFIEKIDPEGNSLWIKVHKYPRFYSAFSRVDYLGNIIFSGVYQNASDRYYHTSFFNSSGDLKWTRLFDGGGYKNIVGLEFDPNGNIVLGGYSNEGSNYNYDVLKYDPSGNLLWNKSHNSGDYSYGTDMTLDIYGNIFMAGISNSNYLTLKYLPNGSIQWARIYDGGAYDEATDVKIDSKGKIIVTGQSRVGGDYDFHTIKYDQDGSILWNRTRGFGNSNERPTDIIIDPQDNIIIAGNPECILIKYNAWGNEEGIYEETGSCSQLLFTDSLENIFFDGVVYNSSNSYYSLTKLRSFAKPEVHFTFALPVEDKTHWSVLFNITSGTSKQPSLKFGVNETATDDFDSHLDILAPPPGPDAKKYSHFEIDNMFFSTLYHDYRSILNLSNPRENWELIIVSDEEVNLSWDSSNVPNEILILQMDIDGTVVDMKENHNYTIPAGSYRINVTADLAMAIPLKTGWNMISLPVENGLIIIPPTVIPYAYWYDPLTGSYNLVDVINMTQGNGYWVAAISDSNISIMGTPLNSYSSNLSMGWNMIGSINGGTGISSISTTPPNSILPYFYWYDPGTSSYGLTDKLEQKKGYWAAAVIDCKMEVG